MTKKQIIKQIGLGGIKALRYAEVFRNPKGMIFKNSKSTFYKNDTEVLHF